MNEISKIREDACEKVQLFLDLHNGDDETWKRLRWGSFLVYTYLHTEEYLEEIVTFDDKNEAEAYLQSILDEWGEDPSRDEDPILYFNGPDAYSELDEKDIEDLREYFRIKDWDGPIRRGTHLSASRTVGLANAYDFANVLPYEMLKDLFANLFTSNLVPGYYDE